MKYCKPVWLGTKLSFQHNDQVLQVVQATDQVLQAKGSLIITPEWH